MKHNATSGQNATPPWGVRPAHPLDVSVQPPLVAATCVAAGVPSLSSLALGGDCSLDSYTVSFLVRLAVGAQAELDRRKRREEEEKAKAKKAKEAKESLQKLLERLTAEGRRDLEERLDSGGASSKRKRKKRRKRRTPRTSSRSSCGRSRRRQRQWCVRHAGFAGSCAPRDVFPVAYDWPLLLGNTAGMDQKDSIFVAVMAAVACSRLVLLVSLFPLPFCLGQALMLRIMDGISQKDCYSVGWFCWCFCTSRCVSFLLSGP